jgi:hypothetical protein
MKQAVVGFGVWLVLCGFSYNTGSDQSQHQSQHQAAVGVGYSEGSEAGASVVNTTPKERELYKGALAQDVPEGNEGPIIATPWGGLGASRQAEITRIVAAYNLLAPDDARREELASQAVEAAAPCRFFGLGPQRFSILFGADCWTSLR